jgi:hypothetical protein
MQTGVDRSQVENEARAKIFWGDPPETVINYLRMQGISYDEAVALTDEFMRERVADIRKSAIGRILIGSGLIAVPVIALIIQASVSFYSAKLIGVTGAVGLFGAWKLLQGILALVFPESEAGDRADDQ